MNNIECSGIARMSAVHAAGGQAEVSTPVAASAVAASLVEQIASAKSKAQPSPRDIDALVVEARTPSIALHSRQPGMQQLRGLAAASEQVADVAVDSTHSARMSGCCADVHECTSADVGSSEQ